MPYGTVNQGDRACCHHIPPGVTTDHVFLTPTPSPALRLPQEVQSKVESGTHPGQPYLVIKRIGKAKDGAGGGGLLESGGEEWVAKNLTRESWGNSRRLRSKELRCQAPGAQSIVPLDLIYTVQIPTKKVGFSRQ